MSTFGKIKDKLLVAKDAQNRRENKTKICYLILLEKNSSVSGIVM